MKKLIRMPSIKLFKSAVRNITNVVRFSGLDENGNSIYNINPLPILKAVGTVKLHGTNVSVCHNLKDGIWSQSKKNIITPEKDNAGFALFVSQNIDVFKNIIFTIENYHRIDNSENTITVYGEWAGKGIQKGVAVSELNKSFYIFGAKITPFNEENQSYWVDSNIFSGKINNDHIYHIKDFETFEIEIDFNNPLLSNNKMIDMVDIVETECPVAKQFGISGIGEGIVFETFYNDLIYRWKMKGTKHAGKSKIKKTHKVDDKKLQLIIDIVEKVTPEWRLSQMYQETFDTINGGKSDIKKTGDFIRSIIKDITKEESDLISSVGLTSKDLNSSIGKKSRLWFMKKLDEECGLK